MSTKFEQLLDYLVNEEHEKANELFHDIVVEKSRQIYDSMIAEEVEEDEEEVDEARDEEDDEEVDESFGDEEESMYEIGGDAADDLVGDTEMDDSEDDMDMDLDTDSMDDSGFGNDEGGEEPATKDDVLDLKDALEELKAEFEALLAAEQNEEEHEPGVHGEPSPLDNLDDEEGEEDYSDEEEDEEDAAYEAFVREYREVVGKPYSGGKVAGTSEDSGTNTHSPVSSAKGRPTTGATAGNIAQNQKGEDRKMGADGKSLAGNIKGEFTKGVEKNISNKASSSMKSGADLGKVAAGHGAEKKGSGETKANTKDILPN